MNNTSIDNIYFATIQKAGSQWISAVFSDHRIQKYTNLTTYPQHRYEWDQFHKTFPMYTFVPGLYMSYDLYEEITKSENYKTFYVTRDPRDIVVSWYYSMLESHVPMGKVLKYREILKKLNYDDGIEYCIKTLASKFAGMRTWFYNHDDNVYICKFENITKYPDEEFQKIFEHCEIDIPKNILKQVLNDYKKEKMRKKDIIQRNFDKTSHYRKKGSTHITAFKDKHYELFYNINGDLLKTLGYEK